MLKKLDTRSLNIVVGLIMLITTLLGYLYVNDTFVASAMWPAIGFAVGIYYVFENKSLPGLVLGILIAHLIARFTLLDENAFIMIAFSLVFTLASLVEVYIFRRITAGLKVFDKFTLFTALVFLFSAISVSMIGAIISVGIISVVNSSANMIEPFLRWSFGDFSGIIIFGTVVLFSLKYDKKIITTRNKNISGVIFISAFVLTSYLLFAETIDGFTFGRYSFIFIIFFFVVPFIFSYRMIMIIDGLFLLMYSAFFVGLTVTSRLGPVLLSLNILLFVLSSIAVITKRGLYTLEERNKALSDSKKKFEHLVDSTNSLFIIKNEMMNRNTEIDANNLVEMFNVAKQVFDNYEYASCYTNMDGEVNFVSAIGYDIDVLNKYFSNVEDFSWDMDEPIIVNNADMLLRESLKDKFDEFTSHSSTIKSSIRFNIFVDQEVVGGMSFDLMENSEKAFTQLDLDLFRTYQQLMNNFYAVNILNTKNVNLKNDIVLSLIRTLELYDHYTGGHSEEVAYLSGQLATRMNLDEKEIYNTYWAGIVHDIGKVGIPSDIINKPEKLSLEEYEQIKDHPVFGYQILSKSEDLKEIALLVRYHHEWWNGAGYPDQLVGDKIPIGAQILGVCDAVSSMATKRPYTLVKSSRQIIEELKLYSGSQFSPNTAEAMILFIEEGLLDEYYKDK